jgi:hypothetical protein
MLTCFNSRGLALSTSRRCRRGFISTSSSSSSVILAGAQAAAQPHLAFRRPTSIDANKLHLSARPTSLAPIERAKRAALFNHLILINRRAAPRAIIRAPSRHSPGAQPRAAGVTGEEAPRRKKP